MDRRSFLRTGGIAALASAVAPGRALAGEQPQAQAAFVPADNFEDANFGSGPRISNRLNQGPFPQYAPESVVPDSDVMMATVAHREPNRGFGKGLITYIVADQGLDEIDATDKLKEVERLVAFPLGDKIYIRPTWREIQPVPGRLRFPAYWHRAFAAAKQHGKRVCFRIQMRAPDYGVEALPDFVLERVPMVRLSGYAGEDRWGERAYFEPRYDHPFFQSAWRDLVERLAEQYDGHPLVETVDTFMYGFWGEGHTWPFENNPFPSYAVAEKTWVRMFEHQRKLWKRTPLVTNTQPDFSRVGNSELVDRTVRSFNWLRTDTVFIENTQIDQISNRPPWTGAMLEVGMRPQLPGPSSNPANISRVENTMRHVLDVGPNYWSLWNFHGISVRNLQRYADRFPGIFEEIRARIGYRVRPTLIWAYEKDGRPGLVVGVTNDGVAAVPGALRISVETRDGRRLAGGSLDPGYPHPGKIRQAQLRLPRGTDWRGLRLRAELEVKGVRYPVTWACTPKPNADGTLTLRPNLD
ncbi:hypothetical protein Q5424_16915 [Conexibacter sp. JD483]|uniref:hypothetical protein n=1 Tax=unclassified Conexibacter TaxID=2627773 RepID=UPI002718EDD0|nr:MULTISPECIES: hypothetical protein [unclassified Conexibacter]MDO8185529.1 hypothetical protein [Conexibacter sp. CPCC 205706]MDO8197284.1 hypothetical protein [Conexibacter sp. CPCC 205762]MDR9370780.1 hypothetical protein [Conexibacter sp. JD483]